MPKVEVLPIEKAATPDPQNVNKHTKRGGDLLENSLRKRGAFRSIASAGKGVDIPVTYAGNYTLEKAVEAGFTEIVNVHVTGNQLVNVVRDDIEPGSAEAIALSLEDNESASKSYNPDIDVLSALAAGDSAILAELRKEDKILGLMLDAMENAPIDYDKEWAGMPEFNSANLKPFLTVHVHFKNNDGFTDFKQLLGREINPNKPYVWFPEQEIMRQGTVE